MKAKKLRHPRGLYVLFFTEMWERFSYYGMRAMLVLYLVDGLDASREDALKLYATYTAFVYLTPIFGGYIADRWLGARQSVMVGGLLMALGHFAMAFEPLLNFALALLVVGNGFFKPNISTMVGQLYSRDDPRRDSGFTVFYMGINLGAFISPLVCGTLGEKYGWHYGFATAGIGMVIGVLIFATGQRLLARSPRHYEQLKLGLHHWRLVLIVTALVSLAIWLFVWNWSFIEAIWQGLVNWQRALLFIALIAAFYLPLRKQKSQENMLSRQDYKHIAAIFILGTFVIFFWMGFEQAGGTMNLFALESTNRMIFGWEMPATYFQSLNPLLILFLAPFFSLAFMLMDRTRFALSAPTKMAIGMIILGLGFIVLAIAQERADQIGMVSPMWLVSVFLLHTIGELFLSPVGLSMVTRLAPVQLASLMMGIWFTAMAVANYLAGTLESQLAGSGIPLYWFLVTSSIGSGLLLLLLTPLLKRLMTTPERI